jgi:hypothetical protein
MKKLQNLRKTFPFLSKRTPKPIKMFNMHSLVIRRVSVLSLPGKEDSLQQKKTSKLGKV